MTAPRTDDPLSEFDRLTKKKAAGTDPLAAFDLLVGGSTSPSDKPGDITLPSTGDSQPEPKPAAGRGPSIFTRDLAPVVRSSAARAKHAIGGALDRLLTGNAYQRDVIPRVEGQTGATPVAHPLTTVTTEADPQKVVRRLKRLDPITQVFANTQAGIDTPAEGGEAPYDEATYQDYRRRILEKYNTTADDFEKKRLTRMLGQLEKQRSEALALRKEDPISAAGRAATFGLAQTPERMAVRREHERDIAEGRAVTPEELGAEHIVHEGERPHRVEPGETGSQAVASLVGTVAPFELGERVGMHVVGKIADAIEVGVPRARSIAEALRFAESPVTATTEFGQGAQRIAKGAIRGQAGGAFIGGTEATIHDQPVGKTIAAGVVPYAELGGLFGAMGAGYPSAANDMQTSAYIADATKMIEATRPDQSPIGDKMPEAHGRAIADMIDRLIGAKKAAMTPDERLQLAASQQRPPEGIISDISRPSREARAAAEAERANPPLRTSRDITLEREGVSPTVRARYDEPPPPPPREVPQVLRDMVRLNPETGRLEIPGVWEPGRDIPPREPGAGPDLVRFDERGRPTLPGVWPPPPEEAMPLHDRFDMSKNLERVQAEQRIVEEARANAEAEQRLRAAQESRAAPRTFAEELQAAGEGDAVQRMKDSDLVAYARRVARHTDAVGKQLQQRVWQEIKGRGLDKKVGPAALALAAVAGATQTEDEDKRAALLGAAALTTGQIHEGETFHSRLTRAVEALPKQWESPRPAGDWLGKLSSGGNFSKEEFARVLKPFLEKAKAEKRKLTKQEVIAHTETNRLEMITDRTTPSGVDIVTPAPEEPPPPPPEPERLPDWRQIENAQPTDGPAALRLLRDREVEVQQARDRHEEADTELDDARRRLRRTADNYNVRDNIVDEALRKADDGEGIDVDDAVQRIMDYVETEPPEGFDEPRLSSWSNDRVDHFDTADAETGDDTQGGEWRVVRNYDDDIIRARGATRLEALAEYAEHRGGDSALGNLSEILGSGSKYRVEPDPENNGFKIVSNEWNSEQQRYVEKVESRGLDRNDLVEEWVRDHYEPPEDENADEAYRAVRQAVDEYADKRKEYNEIESETYELREGDPTEDEDFQQRLAEARAEDRRASLEERAAQGLRDYDEEFYLLDEEDRQFIRDARARGAVGTLTPFWDNIDEVTNTRGGQRDLHGTAGGGDAQGAQSVLVFDPAIPHYTFPREGTFEPRDPDQLDVFDSMNSPAKVISFPPREPVTLKATGSSRFQTYQRTPGGKNYREIKVSWGNPLLGLDIGEPPKYTVRKESNNMWQVVDPNGEDLRAYTYITEENANRAAESLNAGHNVEKIDFTGDHWQGAPPNTAVHGRIDEHIYTGEMGMHPALQKIADERLILTKQLGVIGNQHETLAALNGGEQNATAEMHALASRYREISAKVNALDEDYAAGVEAGYGPGTQKLVATNMIEAQSDWKQMGEAGGFFERVKVTPERRGQLKAEASALDVDEEGLQTKFNEDFYGWDKTPEGLRAEELDNKYYSYDKPLTPEETKERSDLSDKRDAYRDKVEKDYNAARAALDARRKEIDEELGGEKLLPGERERLVNNLAKAKERLRLATEAQNKIDYAKNADEWAAAAVEVADAQSRVYRLQAARPVPTMPWRDPDSAFGLAAAILLKEAATADSDLATWSHSTNRMALANLSKKAAEITYDTAVHGQVRRLLKALGYEVKPELITMDGHKHWMIRLSPAMKEAIKKSSFPLLSALALLAAPKEAEAGNADEKKGMSAVPYLIALGLAAGAFKLVPKDIRARLVERAREDGWDTHRVAAMRLYSNPVIPAIRELKRAPAAAGVAAVATLAANSDNKDINNTATPLYALAALAAIGSKNLRAARGSLGKILVDNLARTEAGTRAVRFVNPDALLSPDVRAAILGFEGMKAKGTARQIEFSQKLKKLGPLGDRIVSDFIEGEQFEDPVEVRALKPDDLHAIVMVAQEAAEEVLRGTEMQVEAGALHPEAAIPHYLPGKYAYWEALDAMTERAPRGRGPTQKPRISPIKRRTLERTNLTERNRLGEIREASYRVAVAIEKAYSNTAAAKLFKTLRATPGVIHPEYQAALDDFLTAKELMRQAKATDNAADQATAQAMLDDAEIRRRKVSDKFKLKGGDYVTLPDTKSMGVLRGMVVQRDVGNSLNGLPEKRATDRLLRFWKLSKTVFNPGTHAANVISNTTMAHMAGMRMTEQPYWLTRAAGDMRQYGEATRALAEAGILDVNAVTAGGEGATARTARSEAGLGELAETTRPETAKVLREQGITAPKESVIPTFRKAAQHMRELYNNEDNIFRVAMYLKARAPKQLKLTLAEGGGFGLAPDEAVTYARDSFGNFRTRSPLLRVIRGSVAPFILYPAKALPAFAKNVVDHPFRYITLMAMWGALNEYSKQEVGEVPEEDVDERDRRKYGYFFPGLTQLPFTSKTGAHAATDLSRWTPMSGATDVAMPGTPAAAVSPNAPRLLQPTGPLSDIYGKFVNNIDPFTHEPRYKADYPLKRNIGRALEDAIELVAPSALGFHRQRIMDDIDNRDMEALKTDLLGPTGLRPRYLRAGGNVMNAEIERQRSMQDAKAEARRALSHSQSPDRDAEILQQYLDYADKIEKNFERRAAIKPAEK